MLMVRQMDRKATVCAVVIFCDSHDLLLIQITKVIAQHVFSAEHQYYWSRECLQNYSCSNYKRNIGIAVIII